MSRARSTLTKRQQDLARAKRRINKRAEIIKLQEQGRRIKELEKKVK